MGNIAACQQPLLPLFQRSHWVSDLKAAKKLMKRFEKVQTEFGWAVNYATFKALYKSPSSVQSSSQQIAEGELQEAWQIWATSKGKADVLQIFAATIVCCKASYDEKISALFDLFDMDFNHSITRDEMTIAIRAVLSGYCRFLGIEPPPSTELTDIARLAFKSADRQEQKDNKIAHSELILWSHVTPECLDIVGRFATTDIAEIRKNSSSSSKSAVNVLTGSAFTSSNVADGEFGSGKQNFGSLQSTQNLNVLVHEAAEREKEYLKSKPAIPTIRELSLHEKQHQRRKRNSAEGFDTPDVDPNAPVNGNANSNALNSPFSGITPSPPHYSVNNFSIDSPSSSGSGSVQGVSSPSSKSVNGAPPKWAKKLDDMILLRQLFHQCEIPGSGTPMLVEGDHPKNNTNSNTPLSPRSHRKQASSNAAPAKPCIPGTGSVSFVVFGNLVKTQGGGRWKKLPQFRTLDGPVQAGQTITFRDVLRSFYTEYSANKREIDAMIQATTEAVLNPQAMLMMASAANGGVAGGSNGVGNSGFAKPVPQSMIAKIQEIFEREQAYHRVGDFEPTVSMNRLLDILKPSRKLKDYIDLQQLIELVYIPSLQQASSNSSSASSPRSSSPGANTPPQQPFLPRLNSNASTASSSSTSPPPSSSGSSLVKDKQTTLPEFIRFLFSRTHAFQLDQMNLWINSNGNSNNNGTSSSNSSLPALDSAQKQQLLTLFELYDGDRRGYIELSEFRSGLLKHFNEDQVKSLLQSFNSSSSQQIDWNSFVQIYRNAWANYNPATSGAAQKQTTLPSNTMTNSNIPPIISPRSGGHHYTASQPMNGLHANSARALPRKM